MPNFVKIGVREWAGRTPSLSLDQCVAADVNCTDTVEAGVHPAGTKDAGAEATSGPTDLHNAGAHSHDGENRSPTLCLSDSVVASTLAAVQRPVRFPTDRLDHCCNHSSTQHRYQLAFH